jgi:hypothetical protein
MIHHLPVSAPNIVYTMPKALQMLPVEINSPLYYCGKKKCCKKYKKSEKKRCGSCPGRKN